MSLEEYVSVLFEDHLAAREYRELLARRAADEGAVVVEGFTIDEFFDGQDGPWTREGRLLIYRNGGDCMVPIVVEARRRSVEPAGGEG